jgi:hypothetical protein
MADLLKINRGMLFLYCNDSCRMPFRHLEKLCEQTGISLSFFSDLNTSLLPYCEKRGLKKPKQDSSLAEFLGILFGDGCIVFGEYSVNITCDAYLDNDFIINRVSPLMRDLFGIEPKIRLIENEICCRVYSKKLFLFLSERCGFPVGKKKNRIMVPFWIKQNKEFSKAFLRGLFDTDGGFHKHHKNSAQLEITTYSPDFLKQIYRLLCEHNLNPRLSPKCVWITERAKVEEFFNLIKPKNYKHTFKYKKFKETGVVPLSRDLKMRVSGFEPERQPWQGCVLPDYTTPARKNFRSGKK